LVNAACAAAGVARRTAYDWRDQDETFNTGWEDALDVATETLEREARRRAYEGVLKPMFHKGRKIAEVREYSDTLMIFILKSLRPERYRENHYIKHGGQTLEELIEASHAEDDPPQTRHRPRDHAGNSQGSTGAADRGSAASPFHPQNNEEATA